MRTHFLSAGLCVCALLAVLTLPALAAESAPVRGTCGDGLTWEITAGTNTVLSIEKSGEGTGRMDDYSYVEGSPKPAPWDASKSEIQTVSIGTGVTSIGDYAFYRFSKLDSVHIAGDVTSIGSSAFSECSSLSSVTIPERVASIGEAPFAGCSFYVATVSCPTVPAGLFSGCNLNNLILGEKVSSIEQNFSSLLDPLGGTNLAGITVKEGNESFYSRDGVLFSKDQTRLIRYPKSKSGTSYQLPSTVTSIEDSAFSGCNRLTDVTVPSGVSAIGKSAFEACPKLAAISLPKTMASIGARAFSQCTALKSISLPTGITSIGERMFSSCSALQEIVIPDGVTRIESEAFYFTGLQCVTIPASVTYMGLDAFTMNNQLKDVWFTGSKAQWDKIDIVNRGPNYTPPFTGAAIHYEGLSVDGSRVSGQLTMAVFCPEGQAAGCLIAAVYDPASGKLLDVRLQANPENGREYSFSGLPPAEGSRTVLCVLDGQFRPLLAGQTL